MLRENSSLKRVEPNRLQIELLQQHHLSEIDFSTDNEDENYEVQADLLTNAWNSELTITTFVSFFHSIFHKEKEPQNSSGSGSIVPARQIQAIPTRYWACGKVMQLLAQYGGTRFIFSTATMPSCFGLSVNLFSRRYSLNRFELERVGAMTFRRIHKQPAAGYMEEAISSEILDDCYECNSFG